MLTCTLASCVRIVPAAASFSLSSAAHHCKTVSPPCVSAVIAVASLKPAGHHLRADDIAGGVRGGIATASLKHGQLLTLGFGEAGDRGDNPAASLK